MVFCVQTRSDEESGWYDIGRPWKTKSEAEMFYNILYGFWINSMDERDIEIKDEKFHKNTRIIEMK